MFVIIIIPIQVKDENQCSARRKERGKSQYASRFAKESKEQ
jgi:hypothetical protein